MKRKMLNLIKSNKEKINIVKVEEKKSVKHFPSAVREWKNSIYVFNKNALNMIPYATFSCIKLVKSFFNLYNSKIERKMRSKRLLLRLRRLSLNKIFISNGEFRHTNNKVVITLYIFNRQKHSYINRMKKLRFFSFYILEQKNIARKIIIKSKLKILYFLKKFEENKTVFEKIINKKGFNNNISTNLRKYVIDFYKKYSMKNYIYIKTYYYYKQLVYINRTKYSYTYLKYLKYCLEKLYNKNAEFNLINIKRFYVNSDILSESISLKLTKNRRKILRYLKNLRKKIKISKKKILVEEYTANIEQNSVEKKHIFFNSNIENFVFSALKYKDVTGFRLEARGRLTKRYTASRSVTKLRYKGNLLNIDSSHKGLSTVLLKNNLKSNLQLTKTKSKTRIGSFGIKGWVSGN